MQIVFNSYNLDSKGKYGVENFDGGIAPVRGDNIAAPQLDGRIRVDKYKDQLNHTIYMWCKGDSNMETLLNTVFTSGVHAYSLTIGATTNSYNDAEVYDLRYSIGKIDEYYKLVIDIVVAKP